MAAVVLLVLGALCTEHTVVALVGPRRPDRLAYLWFLQSLVTGELAWMHFCWQVAAGGALVALGALDAGVGWVGLVLLGASCGGLAVLQRRQSLAAAVLDGALRAAAEHSPTPLPPQAGRVRLTALLHPLRPPRDGIEVELDIAYGEHLRQRLDVVRSTRRLPGAPVLVHVHGGSWVGGRRGKQSRTLRYEFARQGWISVDAGYRVSPDATFPDHLVDVKRVVAWVRAHADELGADPSTLVLSGVSSGAHLAALAALTVGDGTLQPGFEDADTSVAGCISTSGIYDLLDRNSDHPGSKLGPFLRRVVLKSDPIAERAVWDAASPIVRVHAGAPPFFVIHGAHDALVWPKEARRFVAALRSASRAPVAYAELPGTQHAFETFYSVRSAHTAIAAVRFGEWVRAGTGKADRRAPASGDDQAVPTGRARG